MNPVMCLEGEMGHNLWCLRLLEQKKKKKKRLCLTAPDNGRGSDIPTWKLNTNSQFSIVSIKNAIHTMDQHDESNINPIIFKNLWKSGIHKKCKIFIWSLLHESINTPEKLQKRLPNWYLNPNWCTLWKKHS